MREPKGQPPSMFHHQIDPSEARPVNAAQKLGVIRKLRELDAEDLIPYLIGDSPCSRS